MTIDNLDFEDFKVEEQLHIGISVKDFKAIVTHAETLKTSVTASYSSPTRPMQLSYHEHGMQCEFTLMTIGDYRGSSVTPAPAAARKVSSAPAEKLPSHQSTPQITIQQRSTAMPPPSQPASGTFTKEPQSQKPQRPSPPPPKPSLDHESLFLPADEDEDRVWGEKNYDEEQDRLGWGASANNVRPYISCHTFKADTNLKESNFRGRRKEQESSSRLQAYPAWPEDPTSCIAPTQRISDASRTLTRDFTRKLILI